MRKPILIGMIFFLLSQFNIHAQSTSGSPDQATQNNIYVSPIPLPLSKDTYGQLGAYVLAPASLTAFKPYLYRDVSRVISLRKRDTSLYFKKHSWLGRKFWNENMLDIRGEDYWFHLDPYVDLQLGKDRRLDTYTYNNTRAVRVEGALKDKVGFYSVIMESQGRFADYFNEYARRQKPYQAYAVVPGRDVSKKFGENGFDYPVSVGGIVVTPMKYIDASFGFDKHFIGDGYRSLFLSNTGAPYTYLKIDSHFWHIRYTNLWTWQRDVMTETGTGEPIKRKYTSIHYLDWNATKHLNIGLFESVTWAKTEDRGFDVQYLNPVILFRAMEFSNGSKGGNAMMGMSVNYRLDMGIKFYSQVLFDELTMSKFIHQKDYWANKYGYQLGVHYYDAFRLPGWHLQAEYNRVRPYTYSHRSHELAFQHVNQAMAHPWGANFDEFVFRTEYLHKRWYGIGQVNLGRKGFDYPEEVDEASYGGDLLRSYRDRVANDGIHILQGNLGNIKIGYLEGGYVLNPSTGLKVFGSVLLRHFTLQTPLEHFPQGNTAWFNLGIRSNLPDWYFDY